MVNALFAIEFFGGIVWRFDHGGSLDSFDR